MSSGKSRWGSRGPPVRRGGGGGGGGYRGGGRDGARRRSRYDTHTDMFPYPLHVLYIPAQLLIRCVIMISIMLT